MTTEELDRQIKENTTYITPDEVERYESFLSALDGLADMLNNDKIDDRRISLAIHALEGISLELHNGRLEVQDAEGGQEMSDEDIVRDYMLAQGAAMLLFQLAAQAATKRDRVAIGEVASKVYDITCAMSKLAQGIPHGMQIMHACNIVQRVKGDIYEELRRRQ